MSLPLVLTVPEVAETLRVSDDAVYRLCQDGDLDARRVGRRWIIPRRAVLAFLGEEDGPGEETGTVVALRDGRADHEEGGQR